MMTLSQTRAALSPKKVTYTHHTYIYFCFAHYADGLIFFKKMTLVAELLNVQNLDTILIIYVVVASSNLLRLLYNARWAITTL